MSASVISSSWRTSRISCLISSSVTCIVATLLSKNPAQVCGNPARREHFIGGALDNRTDGQILHHIEAKLRGLLRQTPPGLAFDQHRWRTANQHHREVAGYTHRNVRRAPFQFDRTIGRRTRAFRKNDEITAASDCSDAIIDQTNTVATVA